MIDHPYRYDHDVPILLRGITRQACGACDYYEVEIPRMGPLHKAIAEALLHGKRHEIALRFVKGPQGDVDGVWNVIMP